MQESIREEIVQKEREVGEVGREIENMKHEIEVQERQKRELSRNLKEIIEENQNLNLNNLMAPMM